MMPHLLSPVERFRSRRREVESLPEVALGISRSVRAGRPLAQALVDADLGVQPRLADTVRHISMGRPIPDALNDWHRHATTDAEELLVAALVLGSSTSGDASRALDVVGDGIRDDVQLDARRRAVLTQSRLSAGLLVGLCVRRNVGNRPVRVPGPYRSGRAGGGRLARCPRRCVDTPPLAEVALMLATPRRRRHHAMHARQDRGLPGAILLLQVLIAGGENPRRAFGRLRAFGEGQSPLAAACRALSSVAAHLELGAGFTGAVIAVERDDTVSESVVRVIDLVRRSEVDGEPLLVHLEILAADLRRRRATALDAAAQRLTVSLLFPLVLCILPAFIVLAIVPLVMNAIAALPT